MATALDIVTRAFRKLGLLPRGEALDALDAEAGLDALNQFMAGWKLRGVDRTHTALALESAFPLAAEFEEPVMLCLAARIAPDYEAPVAFDADEQWRIIQRAYQVVPASSFDADLLRLPSQKRSWVL